MLSLMISWNCIVWAQFFCYFYLREGRSCTFEILANHNRVINLRADSVTRVSVGQLVASSRIWHHCGSFLLLMIDHLRRLSTVVHLLGAKRGITVCCVVLRCHYDFLGWLVGITGRLVEVFIGALVVLGLLSLSHSAHHSILCSNSLQILAESLSVLNKIIKLISYSGDSLPGLAEGQFVPVHLFSLFSLQVDESSLATGAVDGPHVLLREHCVVFEAFSDL